MWIALVIGIILLIVGLVLLFTGRSTQHLVNVIKNAIPTPAGRVGDGFPGEIVSVTGTARSDNPLISEHGQVPCLYYSCSVERDYETTEYEPATKDRPAQRNTRRVTETISSNTQFTSFTVEDESGMVTVIPDDAEFDARETLNRFEQATTSGGASVSIGGFELNLGNGDRTLGYRYRESIIPLDKPIYVAGVVTEDGELGKPRARQNNAALIISHRTQAALIEDWESSARWQAYGSIGSATAGIALVIIAAVLAII
jgi:hypothetical protein